ncbi:MAG: OmpH family outer membrane protein [Pseudomonadota bacterium]
MKDNLMVAVTAAFFINLTTPAVSVAQDYKLGFVNATKVVEESPQYTKAKDDLEKEFNRRNEEVSTRQKELKKLEEQLEKNSSVMSEDKLKDLEKDLVVARRKLKNAQDSFREDFTIRRNEELNRLRKAVGEVVREVAKEEKIDLVLSDGVVYFSERIDISEKVLSRLREKIKLRH